MRTLTLTLYVGTWKLVELATRGRTFPAYYRVALYNEVEPMWYKEPTEFPEPLGVKIATFKNKPGTNRYYLVSPLEDEKVD
jgi:hypothetical protein